jgi:hypothetical protein
MGLFNELIIDTDPPRVIQFKYGMRWQDRYRIGDRIGWDHLVKPDQASGRVVIAGIGPRESDGSFKYYAISIVDDVIESTTEISEADYESLAAKHFGD